MQFASYRILDEIKSVPCNKFPKNKILIYNPWNPVNPLNQWFKLIITENIPPKQTSPQIFEWKLRAQQPLVWIRDLRDFRISLFNHNVVDLGGKVIIKRCFHFKASRRCVTHRRKEEYKIILYKWTLHSNRWRPLKSSKSCKSWLKT
jgi:hypothetical protein